MYDASGKLLLQDDSGTQTLFLPDEEITGTGGTLPAVRYYSLGGVVAVRQDQQHPNPVCGYPISTSGPIPNPDEWRCLSDLGFEAFAGTVNAEDLYRQGTASVTVYARHNGQVIQTETVLLTGSPGNPYRLRLSAGQYVISAPRSDLPGRTVSVRAHQIVRLSFLPACK